MSHMFHNTDMLSDITHCGGIMLMLFSSMEKNKKKGNVKELFCSCTEKSLCKKDYRLTVKWMWVPFITTCIFL